MLSLNDKIVSYLQLNKIVFSNQDFLIVSSNNIEEIIKWNLEKLGPIPSEEVLNSSFDLMQQETKSIEVREERNKRLSATDWLITKAVETNLPVPETWRQYRQELRDISNQQGFPWLVSWPQPPQ